VLKCFSFQKQLYYRRSNYLVPTFFSFQKQLYYRLFRSNYPVPIKTCLLKHPQSDNSDLRLGHRETLMPSCADDALPYLTNEVFFKINNHVKEWKSPDEEIDQEYEDQEMKKAGIRIMKCIKWLIALKWIFICAVGHGETL